MYFPRWRSIAEVSGKCTMETHTGDGSAFNRLGDLATKYVLYTWSGGARKTREVFNTCFTVSNIGTISTKVRPGCMAGILCLSSALRSPCSFVNPTAPCMCIGVCIMPKLCGHRGFLTYAPAPWRLDIMLCNRNNRRKQNKQFASLTGYFHPRMGAVPASGVADHRGIGFSCLPQPRMKRGGHN
jgi:hypothetical protein